jgi:hypothetical protein
MLSTLEATTAESAQYKGRERAVVVIAALACTFSRSLEWFIYSVRAYERCRF